MDVELSADFSSDVLLACNTTPQTLIATETTTGDTVAEISAKAHRLRRLTLQISPLSANITGADPIHRVAHTSRRFGGKDGVTAPYRCRFYPRTVRSTRAQSKQARSQTAQAHRDSPIAPSPSSWFQYDVLGIIHSSFEVFSLRTAADVICAFVVIDCQRTYVGKKNHAPVLVVMFFFQSLILCDTRWPEAAA